MLNKSQRKIITPAELVIELFGGLRPTARILGRSHSAVNQWRKPKSHGGCDGFIPRLIIHKVLDIAERDGLKITAIDLIIGRKK